MHALASFRACCLVAAAFSAACRSVETEAPAAIGAGSIAPIPNTELFTQAGERVRFYDDLVRGQVVVVQFFFVHCEGICPVSTARLLELQERFADELGRGVRFLSITLDPERDTPAVLAEHARDIGAQPGWTFLTGRAADIEVLRRRLGVFDLDPALDADRTQHAGVLVLGNDKKQRWTMKPATLSSSALSAAVERLMAPG
jgi:protein SCO1/2